MVSTVTVQLPETHFVFRFTPTASFETNNTSAADPTFFFIDISASEVILVGGSVEHVMIMWLLNFSFGMK